MGKGERKRGKGKGKGERGKEKRENFYSFTMQPCSPHEILYFPIFNTLVKKKCHFVDLCVKTT